MPNLVYTIPFPDIETLNAQKDTFALATGWKPKVINTEGAEVDNPITQLEHGRLMLNAYMQNSVTAYLATQAAEAARMATIDAATAQFQAITTTVEIVE